MNHEGGTNLARLGFPALNEGNSRLTSPADEGYNCIAWAAGDTERWWWPDSLEQAYWPIGVPRIATLESFSMVFGLFGYKDFTDTSVEPGKQKVAIFASSLGTPTHAARQLASGWWASKLGPQIDIEHELSAIEGPSYGAVALVLARNAKPLR